MENNLLPCPHCGGTAYLNSRYSRKNNTYYIFVMCDNCGAKTASFGSSSNPVDYEWNNYSCKQAASIWNERV